MKGVDDDSKSYKGNDAYTFTKDQYEKLVNFLNSSSSTGNLDASSSKVNMESHTSDLSRISRSLNHLNIGSWIVESGASDHICSLIKIIDSYNKIIPVNIRLPNGYMVMARYSESMTFSPGLIAQDAPFVPEFHMNLILVPKLCFDLDSV